MLRISGIKATHENDTTQYVHQEAANALHISSNKIVSMTIAKKSVDARKKNDVHFVYSVDVTLSCDENELLGRVDTSKVKKVVHTPFAIAKPHKLPTKAPIICGFGPAGMFCALILARAGLAPIVLERGSDVDTRTKAVEGLFDGGALMPECNVQFGEGGAGTFSDGKLTCGVNDERMSFILSEFVRFGADEDILYMAKPHIGTDVLRSIVKNIRTEIIALGGTVHFNTRLHDVKMSGGKVCSVICNTKDGEREFACETLIMAIGHSARDTFEMLYKSGIELIQKPFSMGVRVEHLQSMIDSVQYGDKSKSSVFGAADYKLSCRLPDGRGVYTFCMCPGGSVVGATSEKECVVTNGMSLRARNGTNANAALLCDVRTSDFGSTHPLAGMYFQRKWENAAYVLGGRSYKAPVNLIGAFMEKRVANDFGTVLPTYRPGTTFADINECMPQFVSESLRAAIPMLDRRMHGFASHDAIMTGIETRSSSPVRMLRNEHYESDKNGIFPCGEGAGYAGGIMSAALDGIKIACEIIARCESI